MGVMEVSRRLTRWVRSAFPEGSAEQVLDVLRDLPDEIVGGQDPERVQAALVIRTRGDWYEFRRWVRLAQTDWRDALVGADLGDEDWRDRLDEVLGTGR